jgi:EAL domain-containing protein (putative c-di-GMP-specific phosphodiesterase class I)
VPVRGQPRQRRNAQNTKRIEGNHGIQVPLGAAEVGDAERVEMCRVLSEFRSMKSHAERNLIDEEQTGDPSVSQLDLSWSAAVAIQWRLCGSPKKGALTQEVTIREPVLRVGRHAENALSISNPTVSNHHAELRQTGNSLFVVDLGSTNGTFVNGNRIRGESKLNPGDVLQFGTAVYRVLSSMATSTNATVAIDATNVAVGHALFDRLLSDPAVVPHFQPIVRLANAEIVGYEALARSRLMGLTTPFDMFRVAAERSMESVLSELLRWESVRVGQQLNAMLYLNTHPSELDSTKLLASLVKLRGQYPDTPLTLEIHEAAITSSRCLALLGKQLADLDIRLAYDDFGAGQARLRELAETPPDVIKFDISLIRGIANATTEHRQLLESLVETVKRLHVTPLAEGVETQEEARVCLEVGFELAQGYLFGRPQAIEPDKNIERNLDFVSSAINQVSE